MVILVAGTLRCNMKASPADNLEGSSPGLYEELLQKIQYGEDNPNSKIGKALEQFKADIKSKETRSILFKLRFLSKRMLELFKQNIESGLLAEMFKEALITDDLKTKYKVNDFKISFTIVDPWEYDMCQKELTSLQGRNCGFCRAICMCYGQLLSLRPANLN